MRQLYMTQEQIEGSKDLLSLADACRDWVADPDGRGIVNVRFLDLTPPTKPVMDFVMMIESGGAEIIPVSRAYPPSNVSAMAHLSPSDLTAQLKRQDAWHTQYFGGRRRMRDMEGYDRTSWKSCEADSWGDNVLQMFSKELYGAAVLASSESELAMPFMSTAIGRLCYAMHPIAKELVGWFMRYAGRRLTGSSNPWTAVLPPNVPPWFPTAKVTWEAFFATSDQRTVPGGTYEYKTWAITDQKLTQTAGRKVWLYNDEADIIPMLRQAAA